MPRNGWCIKHAWMKDDEFERKCANCGKIQRRAFSTDPWHNLIRAAGKIHKCQNCKSKEPMSHCEHAYICWSCHDRGVVFCTVCYAMRPATNPSPSGTVGYVPTNELPFCNWCGGYHEEDKEKNAQVQLI